jgi:predicted ArsR family transcriptional regulator
MTFGALAVASRRRVLDMLREAGGPRDAVALAHATGLHPNTVRFHLKVLIEAGYVTEARQAHGGRGRPQAVYASATPGTGDGGYALLAELLASRLDDAHGAQLARSAGERWLHVSTRASGPTPTPPSSPATLGEAAARAMALFTELGFDPVHTPHPDAARIELRACPFLDVARRHPDVVCGVHLGLLRGTVEGGAFEAELFPFAAPGACVAEIKRVPDPGNAQ